MNRLILDTETAGNVNDRQSLRVYDIAWQIADKDFQPVVSRRFLVKEIFFDEADAMQSAYYANKLPQYYAEIAAGNVKVVHLAEIYKQLAADCKDYKVKELWAYNAAFDRDALNVTCEAVSNGLRTWFIPFGVKICCIQHLAAQTILNRSSYFKFAYNGGFYNKKTGNVRTNAEAAYAYLIGDADYKEEHTALEDVKIERQILAACKKVKNGKKDKKPSRTAWKVPQKKWKEWLDKRDIVVKEESDLIDPLTGEWYAILD